MVLSRAIKKWKRDGVSGLIQRTPSYLLDVISSVLFAIRVKLQWPDYTPTIKRTTARFDADQLDPHSHDVRDDLRAERPVLVEFLDDLSKDDVFYDVGANVGLYSMFALRHDTRHVVAIEPHPRAGSDILRNAELNSASSELTLFPVAFGEKTDVISLAGVGRTGHYLSEEATPLRVPVAAGSEYVNKSGVPAPTVMKLDVEGFEPAVLEGMSEILSDGSIRSIYVEVHDEFQERYGESFDIQTYLSERGFSTTVLHSKSDRHWIRGSRETRV